LIERVKHHGATAGWVILLLPLTATLLSVVFSPASNWMVRTALAAFCVLAVARPDAALLITSALVGFGTILSHLAGMPLLRVTEVLVVGSLAGCCVRAIPRDRPLRRALTDRVTTPILLFALTVLASLIVWLRVNQVLTTYPAGYLALLLQFLPRDYFVQPRDFAVVVSAAVILEGLALYVVVAALCRVDPTFFDRGLRMLVAGSAGLAVMSIVRLGEILLRSPGAIEALRATAAGLRISPQIADYIAAGSYFSLCWLVSLGLAMSSRRRVLWMAAGLPSIAGLYLTGSRSVIAAALAGLIALALLGVRQRPAPVRRLIAFALVTVTAMVISYQWIIGRDVAGTLARQSLTIRLELVRAGLHVLATRPLFGVGLDRFFLVAGDHASPELRAQWQGRLNPHNDFLRFGAELGLVGLALFSWILVGAGRQIWRGLRATGDPRLAGVAGGLIAFLVTSTVSNPLMVREVSYVFWIALGLGVGHVARGQAAPARNRVMRPQLVATLLLTALIVLSVPIRAQREVAAVDLLHVTYGLFEWGKERDGTPFRWSGPKARFYAESQARLIEIPLSGAEPADAAQQVEVFIDGRLADRVTVGRGWQKLRAVLPQAAAERPHRIDLAVSPSWTPADVIPGSRDRRKLGVKVGVVEVLVRAEG
jgi:O-antigen ligase